MPELLQSETQDGVTTLIMSNPARLNGWTMEMIDALEAGLKRAAEDEACKVAILTGTGEYYSAGVNLGGSLKLEHPRRLHQFIVDKNKALFQMFLDFPKPILIAVNGPAIGAPVTSATLCDGVIASEKATFSTPFARLGVTPEGCSSVVFPRLLGTKNARRMLEDEGWKPSAREAKEAGLAQWVVPHDDLLDEAKAIARGWIEDGRERTYPLKMTREELSEINARESVELAYAFLSPPFLMGQAKFLWSKKKRPLALMFLSLRATHPAWSRLLP